MMTDQRLTIVQIVSGAGGMYCGSCLHANTLAAAVQQLGHDMLLLPVYTPVRTDEENVSADRVLMGGLNVYLQHASGIFRRMPRFMQRWLDAPWLLRMAAKLGTSTSPKKLGPLTVSMLRGEDGPLAGEIEKLCDALETLKPDVVHLSNLLLVGMARRIRQRLDVPVVCSLTGEDLFLEALPERFREESLDLIAERCDDLSALIAMNAFYAEHVAEYVGIERERIDVVRTGLNLEDYREPPVRQPNSPPVIGFFSRVCRDKGLDQLVDAWLQLVEKPDLAEVRLKVGGYLAPSDRRFLRELEERVQRAGRADQFGYVGELDRQEKIAFLQSVNLVALPSVFPESKGLPAIEAMAAGTPVVLPSHGVFSELIADTSGGVLFEPNDVDSLTNALRQLLREGDRIAQLGDNARQAVFKRYTADRMAEEAVELYHRVIQSNSKEP